MEYKFLFVIFNIAVFLIALFISINKISKAEH